MPRAQAWWLALLLAMGAALRIVPFALERSLWLDEAKLALNVLDRSPARLLEPLDHDQAAPAGFLLLEKLAVDSFGESERALRLVPLLAGLASLWLVYAVARRWLTGAESLLALALFALAQPLVYYANEVKQYSTDVLVALVLLWAAGRAIGTRVSTAPWILIPAGVIGVWLSHPAVFVATEPASRWCSPRGIAASTAGPPCSRAWRRRGPPAFSRTTPSSCDIPTRRGSSCSSGPRAFHPCLPDRRRSPVAGRNLLWLLHRPGRAALRGARRHRVDRRLLAVVAERPARARPARLSRRLHPCWRASSAVIPSPPPAP